MWALVELTDDAERAHVTCFNEFEEALDALKDLIVEMYKGTFDEEEEEIAFNSAVDDASNLTMLEDLTDGFHFGENDIKIWHLVQVGIGHYE